MILPFWLSIQAMKSSLYTGRREDHPPASHTIRLRWSYGGTGLISGSALGGSGEINGGRIELLIRLAVMHSDSLLP